MEGTPVRPGASGRFVIEASRGWSATQLAEAWTHRELLYFLVWRNIKARFKQTVLGVLWIVLQPVLTMLAFTVFFGRLAGVPSDGVPYAVYALTALVPWQLFAHAVSQSGTSLVSNQELLTNVYFPRLLIPLAGVLEGFVDFGLTFGLFLIFIVAYGVPLSPAVLLLPVLALFAAVTALAAGLWLAALYVRFRDVRFLIPFLIQFWLVATPIAYPSSLVPERWRALYSVNPMVGVVDGFRWALLGVPERLHPSMLVSVAVVAVMLATGLRYFHRVERGFADVI